jgi:hypothetical protein
LNKALQIPRQLSISIRSIIYFGACDTFIYGGEFMPSLEEGDFAVETSFAG